MTTVAPSSIPSAEQLASAGLRLEIADQVATITLDRPTSRNSQTPTMWRALAALGASLPDDVRVVVLRGAGPCFSAGLDRNLLLPGEKAASEESVAELLAMPQAEMTARIHDYQQGFTWLSDPRFVTIAQVHGYAIGAGFQLALSCDVIVAADTAQFCMKEAALGLVPDLAGTKPLVERVGYARALEICATARMVGAEEAVRLGFALEQVPEAELDAAVARHVAAFTAPRVGAVRETKALLQGALTRTLDEQCEVERTAQFRRFTEMAPELGVQPAG
ncbi:enoyl-CoA hydratase/isomerase family protein [Nocardioides sp.]|uniref:enoyl-CoA hydratase/isomerase family protein n=1 Tax=Nocardioides sp. TaxID=35761 RepID=UPI0035151185